MELAAICSQNFLKCSMNSTNWPTMAERIMLSVIFAKMLRKSRFVALAERVGVFQGFFRIIRKSARFGVSFADSST
jgi:hypothetical protein